MKHPELIIVPVLMLCDYLLTVLGAVSSASVYRRHFSIPSYELNPLWRKSVDQLRWFNPRHLLLVLLATGLLVSLDYVGVLSNTANEALDEFEVLLGAIIGVFSVICGRHLGNLLLFRYLNRHPHEISGQVQMSMLLTQKISQFHTVGLIPLSIFIVCLSPSSFTVGVMCGIVIFMLVHFHWARNLSARVGASAKPT